MKTVNKIIVSLICFAMLLPLASCNKNNSKKEDTLASANMFAQKLCEKDIEGIKSLMVSNEEKLNDLDAIINLDHGDDNDIYDLISSSVKYKIVEESYKEDSTESSVTIDFSVTDFDTVLSDKNNLKNHDSLYMALSQAKPDSKTESVSISFVKDDGKMLVKDISPVITFFNSLNIEINYLNIDISSIVDKTDWFGDLSSTYTNTEKIELDIWFTDDIYYVDAFEYYYVVSLDEEEVFKSELLTCKGDKYIPATYEECDKNGYIKAGKYSIKVYTKDDVELGESSVEVLYDSHVKKITPTPLPENYTVEKETISYQITNDSFIKKIVHLGWWDFDSVMPDINIYPDGTKKISFTVQVVDDTNDNLSYFVFYSAEKKENENYDISNSLFTKQIMPKHYNNGTYYEFEYEATDLPAGYYSVIVSSDKDMSDILIKSNCQILSKETEETTETTKK